MKNKFIRYVLVLAMIATSCSLRNDEDNIIDLSFAIEATISKHDEITPDSHFFYIKINRVYLKDRSDLYDTEYKVLFVQNKTESEFSLDELQKLEDYPIWIIPNETFSESQKTIEAKKIGGYRN